ncbi:TetR/AcrR family transcriptional regulator [Streptomyces coeruleorubidus]|uniref:TetR/AcrR family transcriptional regulator n=1 Tax=Streptomyces coeruleorubidus TaxID=116188 RepID=UPI0037B4B5D2
MAKEAGVGPGTLYRHFPTQEALLTAVLQTPPRNWRTAGRTSRSSVTLPRRCGSGCAPFRDSPCMNCGVRHGRVIESGE